jgi:hypothetical protein
MARFGLPLAKHFSDNYAVVGILTLDIQTLKKYVILFPSRTILFSQQPVRRDYTRAVQMADFFFGFLRLRVRAMCILMLDVHLISRN